MDDNSSRTIADAGPSFPSFIALRARHSELLQRDPTADGEKAEYLHEAEEFVSKVQATGAHLSDDEDRRASQNIINYWVSMLFRADNKPRFVTLDCYDVRSTVPVSDVVCPYPGVRPFTEQDSQFFFGRQRQIDYMVGRLKEDRLLVIVGPSGSGKTSLVQAGLLPALKKEQPNNRQHFFFPPIVPGSEPLKSLAHMIARAKDSKEATPEWLQQQVDHFRRDKTHLLKLIEEVTNDPAVIFIDQGEEIYETKVHLLLRPLENILDFDRSQEAIEPFLDNLVRVVQAQSKNHIVIVARRIGDYEPRSQRLPSRVKEIFEPARMVLPALYPSELRDAIEKPAELLGIKFGEAVLQETNANSNLTVKSTESTVQALVREISSEAVGLPLLQFALPKLWERRLANKIPGDALRKMHSCRKALADTADDFYAALPFFEQRICRRLLIDLVRLDRDLKPHVYPVRRTKLYRTTEKHSKVDNLIEQLAEKQLLRISKGEIPITDDWVELTHDSLFSTWPRMVSWIKGKRARRRRNQVAKVIGVASLVAVAILVSFFLIGQQYQWIKSRDLARLSNKHLANNRLDLALLLGFAAYQTQVNIVTRSNLHRLLYNLQFTPRPERFLRKKDFEADDLEFTTERKGPPRGLAAISREGEIVIWDLNWETGKTEGTERTLVSKSTATRPLIFSPDGKTLATASTDPTVQVILWDLASGQHQDLSMSETITTDPTLTTFDATVSSLAFTPNGQTLFSAEQDRVIRWDLNDRAAVKSKTIFIEPIPIPINSISINENGDSLAVGDHDGGVFLLNVSGKRSKPRVIDKGHETDTIGDEAIYNVTFTADGQWLAGSRIDTAKVWQLSDGALQREFHTGLSPTGLLVSFNDKDRSLLGYELDGNVYSWGVQRGAPRGTRLSKKATPAQSVSFSRDGSLVALPDTDGVIIWRISNDQLLRADAPISSVVFKPGTHTLLLVGEAVGITAWNAETPDEHPKLDLPFLDSDVLNLAYSADGKMLAMGLDDGTISLVDANSLQQIHQLKQTKEDEEDQIADIGKVVFHPRPDSHQLVEALNLNAETEDQSAEIILWNTDTGTEVRRLDAMKESSVTALAFRPDGKVLAWATKGKENNSTVTVWDFVEQKPLSKLTPAQAPVTVTSLSFSPDSKVLALGLNNGQIKLFSQDYAEIGSMESVVGEVVDLAFSPDGSMLASATNPRSSQEGKRNPGTVILWDMRSNSQQPEQLGDRLIGHLDAITSISFSSDSKLLASGSKDQGVVLWDVNLAEARDRICKIVDCPRTYNDKEIMDLLDNETPVQRFYRKIMGIPSLRELNP